MKKVKVKCLVDNVWHSGGRMERGTVQEIDAADAVVLLGNKQVAKVTGRGRRKKVDDV